MLTKEYAEQLIRTYHPKQLEHKAAITILALYAENEKLKSELAELKKKHHVINT